MVFRPDGACDYRSSTLINEMVNVCDVAHWFRDATSDRRLEALCRLLDCCMPLELQFLKTYLDELLRRNFVGNQHVDSAMPELHEITDSTCRRQLCLILTRLKTANVLAGCVYNILIQYNFSEFFSRVMVMEEELVDEILLLFTLAANHPAMSFSQRRNLHQRLRDLRETIEKSFKCYHATDVCLQHNREYVCKPLEKSSTEESMSSNEQRPMTEMPSTEPNMQPAENVEKPDVSATENTSDVHIKDLRIVRVQQRPFDKKYEYIFEVTWSNGKLVRIHRAYGELFDFQCKLRRRYSKEISKMTERKVIPYLPARRPIKFCKGNQILPDITHYVREFTKLPEKLLHSEPVENFFSDGTEKKMDEKPQASKTKPNSTNEKIDHTNVANKQHTDMSRVGVDVKTEKGAGPIRNHSPKGKFPTSCPGKKFNNNARRPPLSPKAKEATKPKAIIHHQPKTILKPPNASSPKSSTHTGNDENKKDALATLNEEHLSTENSKRTIAESTPPKTGCDHDSSSEDAFTNCSVTTNDLHTEKHIDSRTSNECNVMEKTQQQSPHPSPQQATSSGEMQRSTALSSSPLTNVTTSPLVITTAENILSTYTSTSSSRTTTSPLNTSPEVSVVTSTPPITILTSSETTPSIVSSSTDTSPPPMSLESATKTPSAALLPVTSNVMSSLSMLSLTTSFVSNMASSTTSSPSSDMITSFVAPTSTRTPPESPLTVSVPVSSPSFVSTFSTSRQLSSDGSFASTSSPIVQRTSEGSDLNVSFDQHHSNGSTCLSSGGFRSSDPQLCTCDPFDHQDLPEDQGFDLCDDEMEAVKLERNMEIQRSTTAIDRSRLTPVSVKNGYTRHHHHNVSQHGLLIVPNGYHHIPTDTSLHYNGYGCHLAEQNNEQMFYEDTFVTDAAKTNDKNCNYIFQNGGSEQTLDFNSNTPYQCKYTPHLNGFSKLSCYNCGERGHLGNQCTAPELEESIIS